MENEKLKQLAAHAFNGACNPLALVHSLHEAIDGMSQDEFRASIEVRIVVGQLSFLLAESLGPSNETCAAYTELTRK